MKEIVLDTETTGISVKEGHRIVEIGCIELDNLIPTKKKFHCYLNPERKVSEKAFEVHGYSDSFLSDKMKFREIADDFLRKNKHKKFVVLDIPLLLENKINKKKDILIFVESEKSEILKRLKKRKNFNMKILNNFKKMQLSLALKKKKSQFIIKNNFKKNSVKVRVKEIIKNLV